MMVPSLRTSLCMLSGPGALPHLRNLTILLSVSEYVNIGPFHVRSVVIGVFRRIKIFIIILYKLVDLIEVFRIKVITLNNKVSFNKLDKQLRLICVMQVSI